MKKEVFDIVLPAEYSKLTPLNRKRVREEYIRLQNNNCMYCNSSLSSPPPASITKNPIDKSLYPIGFFSHPVHLQHNHETDMTEGAVHAFCNCMLFEYEGR
jgi:hypothetical protein